MGGLAGGGCDVCMFGCKSAINLYKSFDNILILRTLSKSFGTGFRNKINFKDISVVNDSLGKPIYIINKKIKNIIFKKFNTNNYEFLLSISDEKKYSIAITIFQKL